jgi:SAM-dependent methyltransferase
VLGYFFKIIKIMTISNTSNTQPVANLDPRHIGPETTKSFQKKVDSGFFDRYFGPAALEIGYDGDVGASTIFPYVIGIDKDYPGYDGIHLPFADHSQDTVYASHVYEHIWEWKEALQEWYRVLKIGGHLIICVPHVWLYEKKPDLPSRYNTDHKRFYAPHNLLEEIWQALPHLGYRVRHMCDNDDGWDDGWRPKEIPEPVDELELAGRTAAYKHEDGRKAKIVSAGEMHPSNGCYEIELVIEKTTVPEWVKYAFGSRKTLGRS